MCKNSGVISNNYAFEDMVVMNNGYVINPIGINAGTPKPMATLMSFDFYNDDIGSTWYNNISWDIDDVQSSSIWGICDGMTLPFFQWQEFDCAKKSTVYHENDEEKSLTVENVKSTFSIFPNPTSNHITFSFEEDFHTIEIFDMLGRMVHSQMNYEKTITLNVSNYNTGMYFVRIISNDGIRANKFVKK